MKLVACVCFASLFNYTSGRKAWVSEDSLNCYRPEKCTQEFYWKLEIFRLEDYFFAWFSAILGERGGRGGGGAVAMFMKNEGTTVGISLRALRS